MQNTKKAEETASKAQRRDSSNNSKHSSSSKFLKRKPDAKKIMLGVGAKKKKQNHLSEYFASDILPTPQNNTADHSERKSCSDKLIVNNWQMKEIHKMGVQQPSRSLQRVRSQQKMGVGYRQLQVESSRGRQNDSNGKDISQFTIFSQTHSKIENVQSDQFITRKFGKQLHFMNVNEKKSKTEFFIEEEVERQVKSSINVEDVYELSFSRVQNSEQDRSKVARAFKKQFQGLFIKNKLLQEQIDFCVQQEYLLKTQRQQLQEIIKEKDQLIKQLSQDKLSSVGKAKDENHMELEKLREILLFTQKQLQKELQRQANLKEENKFLHNELLIKSQELIIAYENHSQLQHNFKQQKKRLKRVIQTMKAEFQQLRTHLKEQQMQIQGYVQVQKCKQKILLQQQQLKYLKIQNHSLLVVKQELRKCETENSKLKDERDYFKKKVLEYVKRSRTQLSEISSSGGSILLELSEISIQH